MQCKECESEVTQSCLTLCDPHGLYPTMLLHPWNFPSKRPGGDCHFLLQRIFLIQGSNPGLPHCREMLYHVSHQRIRNMAKYGKQVEVLIVDSAMSKIY